MINVKFKGVREAIRDLKRFERRVVPLAVREALNSSAFAVQKEWRGEVRRSFVNRNQFTERSILVDKANGFDVNSMRAVVGSIAPYMATQESGGTVSNPSGRKPIPAPAAAGQSPGTRRTKLVKFAHQLSMIRVKKARAATRMQRNAIALAMAKRSGSKHALLERPSGRKGLFLVGGGRRKVTTRLLWDVSRASVRVSPEPTLQRSLNAVHPKLVRIHLDALVRQCRRAGVFGF